MDERPPRTVVAQPQPAPRIPPGSFSMAMGSGRGDRLCISGFVLHIFYLLFFSFLFRFYSYLISHFPFQSPTCLLSIPSLLNSIHYMVLLHVLVISRNKSKNSSGEGVAIRLQLKEWGSAESTRHC